MKQKIILIAVAFLGPLVAFASSNDVEKCEKQIVMYFEKEISQQFKGSGSGCGFEQAFIYKTLFVGETVFVFEVRSDACGGSAIDETVVEKQTCKVLKTTMISSD